MEFFDSSGCGLNKSRILFVLIPTSSHFIFLNED